MGLGVLEDQGEGGLGVVGVRGGRGSRGKGCLGRSESGMKGIGMVED